MVCDTTFEIINDFCQVYCTIPYSFWPFLFYYQKEQCEMLTNITVEPLLPTLFLGF